MAATATISSRYGRTRRGGSASHTSLLALFILSPTAGTVVALWRGVRTLITRHREHRALEGRALALRHRAYAQVPHAHAAFHCPACGFGVLRILGDARAREFHLRHETARLIRVPQPHDLRCDRPGCHHIAMRGAAAAA